MNFSVKFEGTDKREISGTSFRKIGLNWVQAIREKANCRLDTSLIQGWIDPETTHSVKIAISEETAVFLGLFEETHEVEILVPENGLKQFFFIQTNIQRNTINGKILSASLKWVLDEKSLLEEWEKAGFPINWNPKD